MTSLKVAKLERGGKAPVLLVCEHASNAFPDDFGPLGLDETARQSHIAWDPGALDLARALAGELDAPLLHATVSRLIYDLNRPPEAPDAIAAESGGTPVPGNARLSAEECARRVETVYRPWQASLDQAIASTGAKAVITVHSFTPVWNGAKRETEIGILHDADRRLADAILDGAKRAGLGWARNKPYGPEDGVTHTLEAAAERGLFAAMVEVRNDLLRTSQQVRERAGLLARILSPAFADCRLAIPEYDG